MRGKGLVIVMGGRIAELQAELSSANSEGWVRRAREVGDTPPEGIKQRLNDQERLKQMEARGEIKLGSGKIPDAFWEMPRPEDPEGEVMQALLDERESAR